MQLYPLCFWCKLLGLCVYQLACTEMSMLTKHTSGYAHHGASRGNQRIDGWLDMRTLLRDGSWLEEVD